MYNVLVYHFVEGGKANERQLEGIRFWGVRVYIPKENVDIVIRNAFSSLLRCKLIEFVKFVRISEINQSFKYV